jgi:hypothetical protein
VVGQQEHQPAHFERQGSPQRRTHQLEKVFRAENEDERAADVVQERDFHRALFDTRLQLALEHMIPEKDGQNRQRSLQGSEALEIERSGCFGSNDKTGHRLLGDHQRQKGPGSTGLDQVGTFRRAA